MGEKPDTIKVQCSCGQKLKMPGSAAGRRAKCPKCASVFRIPPEDKQPVAASPESSDGGSLLEDLAAMERSAEALAPPEGTRQENPGGVIACLGCGQRLPADAVICVSCGYNTQTGRTTRAANAKRADAAAAVRGAAAGASRILIGCACSLCGALLGAGIWCGVTVATEYEIGWIAWGLGALAGGGMLLGNGGPDARAGVLAALISLVGILAAKVMLIIYILGPEVAEDAGFLAEFVASILHPMDLLFAGLAVASAYKIAAGLVGDD